MDMKGSCDILLVASEPPVEYLLSCAPCALYISIYLIAASSFLNVYDLIRHVNKRIKRIFTNLLFKMVNFLVPCNIIRHPIFNFFLRFTK